MTTSHSNLPSNAKPSGYPSRLCRRRALPAFNGGFAIDEETGRIIANYETVCESSSRHALVQDVGSTFPGVQS